MVVAAFVALLVVISADVIIFIANLVALPLAFLGLEVAIPLMPQSASPFLGDVFGITGGVAVGSGAAVMAGALIWVVLQSARCRNAGWATLIGVVAGVMGGSLYLSLGVVAAFTFGAFGPMWVHLTCAVTGGLCFALLTWGPPHDLVLVDPFCEHCEQWYADAERRRVSLELAEPLIRALESESIVPLADAPIHAVTDLPYLQLSVRKCPRCDVADCELVVEVAWREEEERKREQWVKLMVPADFGAELRQALLTDEQKNE